VQATFSFITDSESQPASTINKGKKAEELTLNIIIPAEYL
jgi:hypothetical protein